MQVDFEIWKKNLYKIQNTSQAINVCSTSCEQRFELLTKTDTGKVNVPFLNYEETEITASTPPICHT